MADGPPSKRQRSQVVTIKVGPDPCQDVFLHDTTIKATSEFFRAALDNKWKGEDLIINLPEDEADVFSGYANRLYDGQVDAHLEWQASCAERHARMLSKITDSRLVKMYIFGEKVLDAEFCSAVIRALVINSDYGNGDHRILATRHVNQFYKGTAPDCPGRQFLVDLWVAVSHDGYTVDDLTVFHREFARDLIHALMSKPKKERYIKPSLLPANSGSSRSEAKAPLHLKVDGASFDSSVTQSRSIWASTAI